ncbi:MAG: AAA family ATPase [Chloroflexi bacterium]|nr:AAA family ATPase [Chloroflexota bacterium]
MAANTVLLVENDRGTAEIVKSVLSRAGHTVEPVGDSEDVVREASRRDLVIIGSVPAPRNAIDICRDLRSDPGSSSVPILGVAQGTDAEERVALLEAGADDVMVRPVDPRELEARVEALLLRSRRKWSARGLDGASAAGQQRRLIVFFSPKGGVGTTTAAVNVAVALAEAGRRRVAILDLDIQWGQVATHLNVSIRQSIAELLGDEAALSNPEDIAGYAQAHSSGLAVFPAPRRPESIDFVRVDPLRKMLATMPSLYDVIVVDAGSVLDQRAVTLFELADEVVFLVAPEMAGLNALQSMLEALYQADAAIQQRRFVLNHLFARDLVRRRDIEMTIGMPIAVELPFEPFLYPKAVNEGVPVVLAPTRNAPADSFRELATLVGGDDAMPLPGPPAGAQRRGLGGLLRRPGA